MLQRNNSHLNIWKRDTGQGSIFWGLPSENCTFHSRLLIGQFQRKGCIFGPILKIKTWSLYPISLTSSPNAFPHWACGRSNGSCCPPGSSSASRPRWTPWSSKGTELGRSCQSWGKCMWWTKDKYLGKDNDEGDGYLLGPEYDTNCKRKN